MVGKVGKGEIANKLFCVCVNSGNEFVGYITEQNRPYRSPYLKDAKFYKTKRGAEEQIECQRKWHYKESYYKLEVLAVNLLPERID